MKVLVQRVTHAQVRVAEEVVGRIGQGLLVFVGVEPTDDEALADWYADRVAGLRIFQDERGLMNRSVKDVGGGVLVVSQFTLAGNTRSGRRPSFEGAAPPEQGERLYERLVHTLRSAFALSVETGRFRADMQVELCNDGPVTFLIDGPKVKG